MHPLLITSINNIYFYLFINGHLLTTYDIYGIKKIKNRNNIIYNKIFINYFLV